MAMIGLLLAAALTFDCTQILPWEIEKEGKIYTYSAPLKSKTYLDAGDRQYDCVEDSPAGVGARYFVETTMALGEGIKTLRRSRCGPLVFFFQVYTKRCDKADYSPAPDWLKNYANQEELLAVRRKCLKYGRKNVASWWKLRDRNGVEWDAEYVPIPPMDSRIDTCSDLEKITRKVEKYKLVKTGHHLIFVESYSAPIKKIREKIVPTF